MGCRLTIRPASGSPDGRAPSRPERGSGAAEAPDSISLDESGARKFLGSPAYAAPEQFSGGDLTPAASPLSAAAALTYAIRLAISIRRTALVTDAGNEVFNRLTAASAPESVLKG